MNHSVYNGFDLYTNNLIHYWLVTEHQNVEREIGAAEVTTAVSSAGTNADN